MSLTFAAALDPAGLLTAHSASAFPAFAAALSRRAGSGCHVFHHVRGGAGAGRITFADESHDDVFSRISFAASMRLMRLESRLFSFSPS